MNDELLNFIKNFDKLGKDFFIGKRNKIKTFEYHNKIINIKSFKKPTFINGIIYKYFRKSKARRSFENATILLNKGIGTPKPIAFYEKFSRFLLQESYYISEHMSTDLIFRDIFGNEKEYDTHKILKGLAKFTFQLHENGIEFLDHSPGNTLININHKSEYDFYLVDLNRMKFHQKMSFKLRIKNLKKIAPSEHLIKVISLEYAILYKKPENEVYKYLWKHTKKFQHKFITKHILKKKFQFWK